MTANRPGPMVNLGCRIPRALLDRIARLVANTGAARCDVIRRALDLGTAAIEAEADNHAGGQQ